MQSDEIANDKENVEAVVAVFDDPVQASRAAGLMHGDALKVHRVSRVDPTVTSEVPHVKFDNVEHVGLGDTAAGMLKGGAIGAGSGLLLLGVPGLNIAAPIVGALAGAWIGGIAGIDEANRSIELPNQEDYRRMLADGKSFVVITGDEHSRIEYGNKLKELGAEEVYQHPPVLEAIHHQHTESPADRPAKH